MRTFCTRGSVFCNTCRTVQSSRDEAPKIDFFSKMRLISSCLTLVARSSSLRRWSLVGFNVLSKSFASVLIFFDHFFAALSLLVFYLRLRKVSLIASREYIIGISLSVLDKDSALIDSLRGFDSLLVSRFSELSGSTVTLRLEEAWFLFLSASWTIAYLAEDCVIQPTMHITPLSFRFMYFKHWKSLSAGFFFSPQYSMARSKPDKRFHYLVSRRKRFFVVKNIRRFI